MKKIFLLFLPAFFLLAKLNAQTTACNANFTWNISGTTANFLPEITAYATGTYYHWTFGDGAQPVSTIAPYHTFPATGGVFVVTHAMYVYNPNGVLVCKDSVTKEITIPADCVLPNFTYHASALNFLKIEFTNTSQYYNSTDSIAWMFGDGTTSNDINPAHTYANAGVYHVCLLIKKRNSNINCTREKCFDVVVSKPCDLQANFNWQKDPNIFNKVYFANETVNYTNSDTLTWSFGDGTYSHNLNPDHIYANAGKYTVCLTAKRNYNIPGTAICVDSTCKTLEIAVPDCNIVADFTTQANATLTTQIKFTNATTGLLATDSIKWSFGDGTYSKDVSPTHNYAASGTYVVVMEVRRINSVGQILCTKNITKEIHVNEPCIFTPNFSYRNDSAIGNPYKFYFENITNTTVNTYDSIRWNFGDNTNGVNGRTATHTFANAGTYNVCLTIIKLDNNHQLTNCAKYICKTIVIAPSCDITINYTWKADSINKKKIYFTAISNLPSGTTAEVNWGFGDNSPTGSGWNATHEYTAAGKYYVCARIQYGANCIKYKCDSITVTNNTVTCDFIANYTWTTDQTNTKKIYFTNTTITPTPNAIVKWTFGDGTDASSWNAVHEYAQPGKYYVCLKVQYGTSTDCVKYKCDSITVIVPPTTDCKQLSLYTYAPTSVTNSYIFTPLHQNNDVQYTWTFGDGTGSHDMISVHPFSQLGGYNVCLTAFRNINCASTTCKEIRIAAPINCDTVKVAYQYYKDQYMANKVHFFAYSNANAQQQVWKIIKGNDTSYITQNNPIHDFSDTGYYTVCLKITTSGGCVKEYCNVIHIEKITQICELQVYPNPGISQISLNIEETSPEILHAYVYNVSNVLVAEKNQAGVVGNNVLTINTNNLPSGYYTVKIIYGNKICFAKFQKI